jgi:uncharacterized phage protein (TIGR01671 family)
MQDRFKFKYNVYGTLFEVYAIDFCEKYVCVWIDKVSLKGMKLSGSQFDLKNLIQCTGLKDKNGKLIYEGDILRYPPENKDEEKNYVACEVFFHNNDCCDNHIGFQMNRYRFQGCLCGIANYGTRYKFIPKNTERMEVIGNIYQNEELLEQ